MKKNPYPGLFVAIEGLDGSGLTTQTGLLTEALRGEGHPVFATKEPSDNIIGGLIRGSLTGVYKLPPSALQLLFVADRVHHLDLEVTPVLKNRSILVSDRYLWSTIAFGSQDIDRDWLLGLHRHVYLPDVTILLKVSPKTCIKRKAGDRFAFQLFEKEKKLARIWKTYEWLAKKYAKQIVILDGEQKPQEVLAEILNEIKKHPKFKRLKKGLT